MIKEKMFKEFLSCTAGGTKAAQLKGKPIPVEAG